MTSQVGRVILLLFILVWTIQVNAQEVREKAFVKDTIITLGDTELYIALPKVKRKVYPVLMAIHGSGREARSYKPGDAKSSEFYIHQRDLAVDNGFMFVAVSNGPDTWGTNRGLERILEAYYYVGDQYSVEKKWMFWTTSAGGVLFIRLAKESSELISRAIGTFPVYDLQESFSRLGSAKEAWKSLDVVKKYNPVNYPEVLINIPYLIFHGRDDSAVPIKQHSERLKRVVNEHGGKIKLYNVPGGHSTGNWNVYNDILIRAFLVQQDL